MRKRCCLFPTAVVAALLAGAGMASAALPLTDGLMIHLDPSSIQSSEGAVTGWMDISGRGNHAGAAVAPAVGLPSLAVGAVNGLNAGQWGGMIRTFRAVP